MKTRLGISPGIVPDIRRPAVVRAKQRGTDAFLHCEMEENAQ